MPLDNPAFDFALFQTIPIIGICRGWSTEAVLEYADIYLKAGFNTLEVTMNSENVLTTVTALKDQFAGQLNIGAGTVRNQLQAQQAIDAGAQFIVSPIIDVEVIRYCAERRIPIFPGAYTPTEIEYAWRQGATAVKLFPAAIGGLQYLKAIKAPLDDIPLIPTGGITKANIAEFFKVGIYGAGIGSELFPKEHRDNPEALLRHLQEVAQNYFEWTRL